MKNFLTVKRLIIFLFIGFLIYSLPFFINNYINKNRLSIRTTPRFDITTIMNIPHDSIYKEVEIYNKDKFIEYRCLYKDSSLNLIKIGNIDSTIIIKNMVNIKPPPIPYPNTYFSGSIFSLFSYFGGESTFPLFNVYNLPADFVTNVDLYVEGKINDELSDSIKNKVHFKINGTSLGIAINNHSKVDLSYFIGGDNSASDADLYFIIDDNILYSILIAKVYDFNIEYSKKN